MILCLFPPFLDSTMFPFDELSEVGPSHCFSHSEEVDSFYHNCESCYNIEDNTICVVDLSLVYTFYYSPQSAIL